MWMGTFIFGSESNTLQRALSGRHRNNQVGLLYAVSSLDLLLAAAIVLALRAKR